MDESENTRGDERPAGQDAAPAGQDPAPAVRDAAPAGQDPAPAVRDAAPAGQDPAPAVRDSAPAGQDPAPAVRDAAPAGQDPVPTGPRRTGSAWATRIAACVAAGALALGAGFGLAKLVHPSGASSDIPAPAKSGGVFSEDDDGTGQDNETNIMQSTAPGMVHIIAGGHAVGIGLVLTSSGKVLTTYQPSGGSGGLSARYVISGKTYHATVLGTDGAAALALLQMQGAGQAFPTVQVGNSATLVRDADQVNQLSYHLPGEVFDTAVGTSGIQDTVALDTGTLTSLDSTATVGGKSRAGLMQSLLQSSPVTEIGGPLVNLNGQVIGITVVGGGAGPQLTSYAMPINQALAIARYLDTRARHTS